MARRRRFFRPRVSLLHGYILGQFLSVLGVCLIAFCTLFLVFDLFERMRTFIREDTDFSLIMQYLLFQIPLIIQLMMPIALLVATLVTIGKLSQNSEITAMRACGASIVWLSRPLLLVGLLASLLMLLNAETLVPWATQRVDELYYFDIKKKDQSGAYDRSDFWYRVDNKFYSIARYNSRDAQLAGVTVYYLDRTFKLERRLDSELAVWNGPNAGWTMKNVVESLVGAHGSLTTTTFAELPLLIDEKPEDFYNMRRRPETMNYQQLGEYVKKLQQEGVPATEYLVAQAAKISFPFVCFIVVMIGVPFALISARSGTLTMSFVIGVSVGFGYYIFHAISTSLGSAELLPVIPAAWAANILLGSLAAYLLLSSDT